MSWTVMSGFVLFKCLNRFSIALCVAVCVLDVSRVMCHISFPHQSFTTQNAGLCK